MTCDERRAYAIKHYAENKDQILAKTKTPDERKRRCENVKRYYSKSQRHLNAVKMREYHASPEYKAWQMACASRRASERRCLELMATPPWVNRLDLFKIYQESSWMTLISGTPHHVDHIWPLKGKGFNGLNVPWNLQILTAKANRSKQNRRPV
jgi:ribosomal protein L3